MIHSYVKSNFNDFQVFSKLNQLDKNSPVIDEKWNLMIFKYLTIKIIGKKKFDFLNISINYVHVSKVIVYLCHTENELSSYVTEFDCHFRERQASYA